ncbi:hypothetical protein [Mesorhizobium sp. ES1-1]|uniref:hypothetical protein n=1 Tax=Mesorhizobium sp. ES1-1 TaxID=2876629 RepID=UPI001CCB0A36|nr:hypothetical protein [Mesorhizobium sp. ES1-1]MBZ9677610.1 hypothetical protein [Mesorhizobium sp. ES1-1]
MGKKEDQTEIAGGWAIEAVYFARKCGLAKEEALDIFRRAYENVDDEAKRSSVHR